MNRFQLLFAANCQDQKCDAWSAGVVIFIMLSGKYPFKAKTKDELLKVIRKATARGICNHLRKE